jgi:predicted kinase
MAATAIASELRPQPKPRSKREERVHGTGKLTVFSGLMGSGKTTAALRLREQNEAAWLIGRDSIRDAIFAKTDLFCEQEEVITAIMLHIAKLGLSMGHDVIVDDLNLFMDEKLRWNMLARELGVRIRWKHMSTDVDECIRRDAKRVRSVGRVVIEEYAAAAGIHKSSVERVLPA